MTKTYEVTVTAKEPRWNERPGTETVSAKNAAGAIKQVREMVRLEKGPDDGPCSYSARVVR